MSSSSYRYIKFPINRWKHLYSIEQAILHASEDTGRHLIIEGTCPSVDFQAEKSINIELTVVNVTKYPAYKKLHGGHLVLATLQYNTEHKKLSGELLVDNHVFEELRSNIIEYSGIEGIFIEATVGLRLANDQLEPDQSIEMISFEYAMRS